MIVFILASLLCTNTTLCMHKKTPLSDTQKFILITSTSPQDLNYVGLQKELIGKGDQSLLRTKELSDQQKGVLIAAALPEKKLRHEVLHSVLCTNDAAGRYLDAAFEPSIYAENPYPYLAKKLRFFHLSLICDHISNNYIQPYINTLTTKDFLVDISDIQWIDLHLNKNKVHTFLTKSFALDKEVTDLNNTQKAKFSRQYEWGRSDVEIKECKEFLDEEELILNKTICSLKKELKQNSIPTPLMSVYKEVDQNKQAAMCSLIAGNTNEVFNWLRKNPKNRMHMFLRMNKYHQKIFCNFMEKLQDSEKRCVFVSREDAYKIKELPDDVLKTLDALLGRKTYHSKPSSNYYDNTGALVYPKYRSEYLLECMEQMHKESYIPLAVSCAGAIPSLMHSWFLGIPFLDSTKSALALSGSSFLSFSVVHILNEASLGIVFPWCLKIPIFVGSGKLLADTGSPYLGGFVIGFSHALSLPYQDYTPSKNHSVFPSDIGKPGPHRSWLFDYINNQIGKITVFWHFMKKLLK